MKFDLSYKKIIVIFTVFIFQVLGIYLLFKQFFTTSNLLEDLILLIFFSFISLVLIKKSLEIISIFDSELQDRLELLNYISDAIFVVTKKGKIIFYNDIFKNITNFTEEKLTDKSVYELFTFNSLKDTNKVLKNAMRKGKTSCEWPILSGFGEKKIFLVDIEYVRSKSYFVFTTKDITQVKEDEEENDRLKTKLALQSRVATVSEMLENIAHQWRQPLSIISVSVSSLKVNLDYGIEVEDEKIRECSEMVLEQCDYLTNTIDDFRNIFVNDSHIVKIHNVGDILTKLVNLVKFSFESNNIKIVMNVDDNIFIKVDEKALFQAIINIFNNSKDAFIDRKIDLEKRYFVIKARKTNNNIVISLIDSAGGINKENIGKIFEPYFTTKHKAVGTGIGLHMTHQIITKHLGGSIEVKNKNKTINNQEVSGAHFKIELPL